MIDKFSNYIKNAVINVTPFSKVYNGKKYQIGATIFNPNTRISIHYI